VNADSDDEEEKAADSYQKLVASSPEIQSYMNKVTRIIALFLKDSKAPKELYRSVLKFIKIAITYLDFTALPDLLPLILSHVFALANPRDYTSVVRRIVTKLIVKCGADKVRLNTMKEH